MAGESAWPIGRSRLAGAGERLENDVAFHVETDMLEQASNAEFSTFDIYEIVPMCRQHSF